MGVTRRTHAECRIWKPQGKLGVVGHVWEPLCREQLGRASIILNFGTRWSLVASFTPRPLCSQYALKKKGGVSPRTGPDTSETPCALDSSGSGENQRLNPVINLWLDKRLTASEQGLFNGVRLCYSVRRQDNSELWQDVIQLLKMTLGIMQVIIKFIRCTYNLMCF
jgi:hypothetical protein